jgi:hypothetical protein
VKKQEKNSEDEVKLKSLKVGLEVDFQIFSKTLDFADMILKKKNKAIKGKEHKLGTTVLSKDGKGYTKNKRPPKSYNK